MGAEQSHDADSDLVGGFKRDVPEPRQRKKVVKGPQKDAYFQYTKVDDHIRAIHDDHRKNEKRKIAEQDGSVDIASVLSELNLSNDKDKEADNPDLTNNVPDILEENSEDDSSSDEEENRGMYHQEVQKVEAIETDVSHSEAHPVSILGLVSVGQTLRVKDMSPWRNQFPIHRIHWHISNGIVEQHSFSPMIASDETTFVLNEEHLGHFIQVRATRRVERQVKDTLVEHVEGGVYDPHIRAAAAHAEKGVERVIFDVESTSVVGPVLISDAWAAALVHSLAEGSFEVAVKLHDEVRELDRRRPSKKIPAVLRLTIESLDFHYVTPSHEESGRNRIFSLEWLKYLVGDNKDEKKKKVTPNTQVVASLPLKRISVRPVLDSRKALILAVTRQKRPVELIRLDVDTRVGRTLLMCHIIAFQKASAVSQNEWQEVADSGEYDLPKGLVQKRLEGKLIIVVIKFFYRSRNICQSRSTCI